MNARRTEGRKRLRRRRARWWAWRSSAFLAMLFIAMAAHYSNDGPPYFAANEAVADTGDATAEPPARVELAGAVVTAELRPPPLPARPILSYSGLWWRTRTSRAQPGESIEVSLTAYCLKGTTRRENYVRQGIVAADPRVFPLGRYVEVYIGDNYLGRFLVDDTGGIIKGTILDIWTPTCREARRFGRQRGTAILVPRNADPAPTPDVTELMSYVGKRRPKRPARALAAAPTPASRDSQPGVPLLPSPGRLAPPPAAIP